MSRRSLKEEILLYSSEAIEAARDCWNRDAIPWLLQAIRLLSILEQLEPNEQAVNQIENARLYVEHLRGPIEAPKLPMQYCLNYAVKNLRTAQRAYGG